MVSTSGGREASCAHNSTQLPAANTPAKVHFRRFHRVKFIILCLIPALNLVAASADVDVYSPQQLQAMSQKLAARKSAFAAEQLSKYGNHYTMLAFRESTGSAEVHETEADLFVVTEGHAAIVTGGRSEER